jgi:hypothetical protein
MRYLRECFKTLFAGMGERKFPLIPSVKAALLLIGIVVAAVTGVTMTSPTTAAATTILVLALLFWIMLDYAVRLRRKIAPKIILDFTSGGGCLVETPFQEKMWIAIGGQFVESAKEIKAVYVRAVVTNTESFPRGIARLP